MIVSASRRTDIPAFYSKWFMNRIRTGYCLVPNPFNSKQISRISLDPADVYVIVFWTRNPRPLLSHLPELDDRGYRYYFLYTLMANPREIDPGAPFVAASIRTFRELSDRIGPARVVWRYDPIFLSTLTDPGFHLRAYGHIASSLKGYTTRCAVSIVHMYRKIQKRLGELSKQGIYILPCEEEALSPLLRSLAEVSSENGIEIRCCADELDLQRYGIQPGKCVDDELIFNAFGFEVGAGKDVSQRKSCGCVASKYIGMYDSCLFGCVYCYRECAGRYQELMSPNAPSRRLHLDVATRIIFVIDGREDSVRFHTMPADDSIVAVGGRGRSPFGKGPAPP